MIRISQENGQVVIKPATFLGGDKFSAYLAAVTGAKYDPKGKRQVTVLTKLAPIVERLQAAGFELDVAPDVRASLQALTAQTRLDLDATRMRADTKDVELAKRGRALYPFQRIGMEWLSTMHGGLLADEMGTGKTIQTLMALPENVPVLVICPAVAKGVWRREAAVWRPEYRVTVLSGRGSFRWPAPGEIVCINYDILPDLQWDKEHGVGSEVATPLSGTVLIGDEIHAAKNPKSKRTKAWRSLVVATQKARGRVWGLTGTPVLNIGPELWAILQSLGLATDSFGKWDKFVTLMGGHKGKFGYEWARVPPDPTAVGDVLRPVMLRRLRTEVLPELPTKTYETVTVDLPKSIVKVCDKANTEFETANKTWLIEHANKDFSGPGEGMTIGMIAEARAALATAKIPTLIALIEEHEEIGEPLVVFSAHRAPIDALATREGWAVITGDTSPAERTRIEDAFQRGELKGVGGTVRAAGVAITLTRAHRAVFVDRDWTPALNSQCEDRVCRIGQDRGVIITDLVGDHALDRRVHEVLSRKRDLIDATVEQGRTMTPVVEVKSVQLPAAKVIESPVVDALNQAHRNGSLPVKANGSNGSRRGPETAREVWAAQALEKLAGNDLDHAMELNGVGFNRLDNHFGHSLAGQVSRYGLTSTQWAAAIQLCTKYQGQVGAIPKE
jgi:SWI/SNF-related matrix-associated actin-dependent regulator of chromatin subfamily A-like protein 1